MSISSVSPRMVSFGQQKQKQKYENPVNRKMEYYGTVLSSVGGSAVVGAVAGVATKYITKASDKLAKSSTKWGIAAGAVGVLATLALTLPSALYHKSVGVFAKEKEFDVYSRSKSAETSLAEQIDDITKDSNVPLKESVDMFAKYNIARRGNGVGIYGM